MCSLESDLSKHTMLAVSQQFISIIHKSTSGKNIHNVSASLFHASRVKSVIDEWFKQTNCAGYFKKTRLICFMILPVHKSDNMCLLSY